MNGPLRGLQAGVNDLQHALPNLIDACTAPDASDLAELLFHVQSARIALQQMERDVEAATAKAMLGDQVVTATVRAERYRSADRKEWDHERWQADLRAKVLQAHGLKGAQGVLTAEGEVVPAEVLHDLLRAVEAVHSSGAPKTSKTAGLRAYGLDPDDYCTTTKGAWHVRVQLLADETETEGAA